MDNNFKLDLTLLSKELKLLLELMKEENEENIQRNKEELFTTIDWDHFLQLTRHHRVYPLIYMRLKSVDESLVPKEVIETLYEEYKRNTFQMIQLSAEMDRVSKLFTDNGIQLLFLKGPVIAYEIYGDISLRTSKDLDILVKEMDFEKVEELLFGLGYKREEVLTILNERKWRYKDIVYYHPKIGMQIEIHWSTQPLSMRAPSFNELWEEKRTSSLTGSSIFFLGEDHLFVYLVSHGARHGWFRLRWLKDIDQMMRNGINFEKTFALLRKYKYHFAMGQTFILSAQLLQNPVYEEMKRKIEGKKVRSLAGKAYLFIRDEECESVDTAYSFLLRDNLQKCIFIFSLFYPTYKDAEVLKLPKRLCFLYFPLRPFLWMWRKTKQYVSS
ncbi:Renal dipeptidase [Bacillus cereus]|nr:Renal dipeptidase [Bacillus cereus]PFN75170.1 Renal dipeptidase [Bacillus cereus]